MKPANLAATAILDFEHPRVRALANELGAGDPSPREYARRAHRAISERVRPVYTVDELQPVSATLAKGRGACSQRLACVEALARARGVGTRVRALRVDGRFWAPRFGPMRVFIPGRILLAWPQLWLDGGWVDVDELHASTADLVARGDGGFANDGETMFDALAHTAVDFLGKSKQCGAGCALNVTAYDLSKHVLADEGFFDTRDELFARLGLLSRTLRGRAFELVYGGRKSA